MTSTPTTMTGMLRIAQLNMMRSKHVGFEARERIDDENVDIFCMTEPYSLNGKVGALSLSTLNITGAMQDPQAAISFHTANVEVTKLTQFCDKHCVCAEIRSDIGVFYLVSAYFQYSESTSIHLAKLESILLTLRGKQVILTGDFNARSIVWHDRITDENGREVEDFINKNNLEIVNEAGNPSTFCHNGESCIDLTLATRGISNRIKNWRVRTEWTSSDHRGITFEISSCLNRVSATDGEKRFALRKANWGLVTAQMYAEWIQMNPTPVLSSGEDIETFTNTVTNSITKVCNMTIPIKGTNKRRIKWWNPVLTALKKEVSKLRRIYQREKDPVRREAKKKVYAERRCWYFDSVEKSRQDSFEKYVTEYGNDDPWGLVYKYSVGKLRAKQVPSTLIDQGIATTNWRDTAVTLLNVLLPDDMPDETLQHQRIREEMEEIPDTPNDEPFDSLEVERAVMSLKKGKSPGIDNVEVEVLQKTWCVIWESVIHLLNNCLEKGIFPKAWKVGKVIILKKSGDRVETNAKAYRPIMLLPVLGKLFEKLLVGRLMCKVNTSGVFSDKQYGFRPKLSTEDAIVNLVNKVQSSSAKYVLGIFLDISGAFDNLWWPSVMNELKRYDCQRNIYKTLYSYFKDRTAVIVDKFGRTEKNITKGCPQGSVLGPQIWNIVFNGSMNEEVDELAFADDKVILIYGKSRADLERKGQKAMDFMIEWCKRSKMDLSAEKTVLLQLKGKYDSNRPPTIKADGRSLKMVTSVKHLGVDFDERLGVTTHVNRICENTKNLSYALARVAKDNWGLRPNTLKIIYRGVVESTLSYAAAGWAERMNCRHVRALESAQRSILLRMTSCYRTTPKSAVQVISGVIPIDLLIKERIASYKFRKGQTAVHDTVSFVPGTITKRQCKSYLREVSVCVWQTRWENSVDGRLTREFLPDVADMYRRKVDIKGPIVQILTGHGKLRQYLNRFGIVDTEMCQCELGVQEVNHILFECVLMEGHRVTLRSELNNRRIAWPPSKERLMQNDIFNIFRSFATQIILELINWNRR